MGRSFLPGDLLTRMGPLAHSQDGPSAGVPLLLASAWRAEAAPSACRSAEAFRPPTAWVPAVREPPACGMLPHSGRPAGARFKAQGIRHLYRGARAPRSKSAAMPFEPYSPTRVLFLGTAWGCGG